MMRTGISWTDETWNPVRGCQRVSEGCRHCYAERQAVRIVRMGKGKPTPYDNLVKLVNGEPRWTGAVSLDPDRLAAPLSWRTPRQVFVDSMSDLFYDGRSNEDIAAVFGVMAATQHITYQILTKYARRMREWFVWLDGQTSSGDGRGDTQAELCRAAALSARQWRASDGSMPPGPGRALLGYDTRWPLPNVWIGVSVENQDAADERIPDLLATPAAVWFLSCEPLLGPLDLSPWLAAATRSMDDAPLHQVIVGAESGPGARAADDQWFRDLRDQCARAGVAFFVKQMVVDGRLRKDVREFPADLQIQGFPDARARQARDRAGPAAAAFPTTNGDQR